ncbi:DUF1064 domain-containing protein [Paracoccus sp. Z330]|uniref:DUF1064 domain-containing protein n=1 Tax=Paracoccus onchidii TaxID=3017813 RepID=A0ABT4ZIB8_9RHOB|nr:DUF1064 domain-containing protein [Paracoccus onchidii]MDB6178984.1 DUF1064 domain-containing protein [Paracoccus onchidii]
MTIRMTAAQLQNMQAPKKGRKRVQNAQPIEVDGHKFDSKGEARRWMVLKALENTGQITELRRQVSITLQGMNGPILTPSGRPMTCRLDYTYIDGKGRQVFEDFKGHQTDESVLKYAILAAQGVKVSVVKKPGTASGRWTENDYTALHRRIVGKEVKV